MALISYDVFIERMRSHDPLVANRVAQHVANKFSMVAADVRAKLAEGHFRVKSSVDRATADALVAELTAMGAECALFDNRGQRINVAPGSASAMRAVVAAPSDRTLAAPGASAPSDRTVAAADSSPDQAWDALSSLQLSDVDDNKSSPTTSAAPPTRAPRSGNTIPPPPASRVPASLPPLPGSDRRLAADDAPTIADDRFAPPPPTFSPTVDSPLSLSRPAPPPAPAQPLPPPPTGAATSSATSAAPASSSATARANAAVARPSGIVARDNPLSFLRDARTHFLAGVAICVLVGFLPSLIYSSIREKNLGAEIDRKLKATYAQVTTPDEWDELPAARERALTEKQREQRDVGTTGMLLWLVCGGGLAWLWFRTLDWDSLTA